MTTRQTYKGGPGAARQIAKKTVSAQRSGAVASGVIRERESAKTKTFILKFEKGQVFVKRSQPGR